MKIIRSNSELERLHSAGVGFIYNDYSGMGSTGKDYNVLHTARCAFVLRSKVKGSTRIIPKYFFNNIDEAVKWLRRNRGREGKNWKRCGVCLAEARPRYQIPLRTRPVDRTEPAPVRSKVFTEKHVENILIKHLNSNGYRIRRQVRVASGLIDVVAEGPDGLWVIEVKGEDKGGYTSAEMNFQIGLGQLMSRMKHRDAEYGLAFPLTRDFMKVLRKYKGSLAFEKLGIYIIPVKRDGSCQLVSSSDVLKFLDEIATSN